MNNTTVDIIINLLIFVITAGIIFRFSRKDGQRAPEQLRFVFRFYTTQSNVLCAVSALLMAVFTLTGNVPEWVWLLKYIGTAAVTVTMLTVFFFLAPSIASIGKNWVEILLTGSDIFMHLLTPLMALVSFCVFEKRGMTFPQCLLGVLPVVLYGPLYLYKILYAPEEKRWDDFYGFNRNGKWKIAFCALLLGTVAICFVLMVIQNI